MNDPKIGDFIQYSGHADFVLTELLEHYPAELVAFKRKTTEGETDPRTLAKQVVVEEPAARVMVREKLTRESTREDAARVAKEINAAFPDVVAVIQERVKATAPEHIAALEAGVIIRFQNDIYHCRRLASALVAGGANNWSLPGTLHYPQVGEKVSHDGHEDFAITSIDGPTARFERGERFKEKDHVDVTCQTDELVYFDEDDAWILVGRLLSRPQRQEWMALVGSKMAPHPEKHPEVRRILRASAAK